MAAMTPLRWFRKSSDGYTFVEIVVVTGIMAILATAALPIARVSMKRQREAELRRTLREVRTAIDQFKDWADAGLIAQTELSMVAEHYPTSLEQLVDGVLLANDASGRKKKFLRRIPIDPFTGSTDWGKRAYADQPDTKVWGGSSVYDIFTKFDGKALDGSKYRDW
jgi:general secretion pathway protein G